MSAEVETKTPSFQLLRTVMPQTSNEYSPEVYSTSSETMSFTGSSIIGTAGSLTFSTTAGSLETGSSLVALVGSGFFSGSFTSVTTGTG